MWLWDGSSGSRSQEVITPERRTIAEDGEGRQIGRATEHSASVWLSLMSYFRER